MIAIIGLGAGGHARVVMDSLRRIGGIEVRALLDVDSALWGKTVDGVEIAGGDEKLSEYSDQGIEYVFMGIGGVASQHPRKKLFEMVKGLNFSFLQIIDPNAVLSPSATLGEGAVVLARAIINANARIGDNTIVNTGAIVEHDCEVGPHVHIATGARLAGNVTVGGGSMVGMGSNIKQGVTIGKNAVVGGGAMVVGDVKDNATVIGVPAIEMEPTDR